jgi:ABC-type multidrug transport system ATPase subunit
MITNSVSLLIPLPIVGVLLAVWLIRRRPARPEADPARMGLSPWQNLTLRAAGVLPQLARQVPTEVGKLSARGVSVLVIALADGLAVGYATNVLFGFPVVAAVNATIVSMIFVFHLDRAIVSTPLGRGWQKIGVAIGLRLVFSLGVIVPTVEVPLELLLLHKEVALQVSEDQGKANDDFKLVLDQRYGKREQDAKMVISDGQDAINKAQGAADEAVRLRDCEKLGVKDPALRCADTTGDIGDGRNTKIRQHEVDVTQEQLTKVKDEQQPKIKAAEDELAAVARGRAEDEQRHSDQVAQSDGLMARWNALETAIEKWDAELLVWVLRLVLVIIDLAPLGVKLLAKTPGYSALEKAERTRARRAAEVEKERIAKATEVEMERIAKATEVEMERIAKATEVEKERIAKAIEAERAEIAKRGERTRPDPHPVTALPAEGGGARVVVENLTAHRKNVPILDDVSFEIAPGKVVALLAPSGSGKSTLLDVLLGHLPAAGGRVTIDGDPPAPRNRLVGFVPQRTLLTPQLTVEEILTDAAVLGAVPAAELEAHVVEMMDRLQLLHRRGHRVSSAGEGQGLSGGERRRLAVGAELLRGTAVLLLDEPTTGLDADLDREIMSMLREISGTHGTTVIVATHATDHLDRVDKILMLDGGGRKAYDGAPRDVLARFGKSTWADLMNSMRTSGRVRPAASREDPDVAAA